MKSKILSLKKFIERANNLIENNILGSFNKIKSFFLKSYYCLDIILAYLIYGSTLTDYFVYEFYKKRHFERKTFVTFRKANVLFKHFLAPEFRKGVENKKDSNTIYEKFINRKWLCINSSTFSNFIEFTNNNKKFIVKPCIGALGSGIYVIDTDGKNLQEIFQNLKKENVIIEELIVQHEHMQKLYPDSVNTVRVTAIHKDKEVVIVGAVLRMGNSGMIVDNWSSGGIAASLDKSNGFVCFPGRDKYFNTYYVHPSTGVKIPGFQVPAWDDIIEIVKKAATINTKARYAGWDVAITEKGPIIIETNHQGSMDIQQQSSQIGKWYEYKKHMA